LDLEGLGVVALSSLDGYHVTQKLSRLAYAKPEQKSPDSQLDFLKGWEDV
jgi:hypothetical protein